jgi:hypothetical protein
MHSGGYMSGYPFKNVELQAGEDQQLDRQWGGEKWNSTFITSASTNLCKTGAGVLGSIVVGETAAGTVKIYDAVTATNQKGELKASIVEGTYRYNMAFTTGLTIVTSAASKITVNWL